MVQETLDFDESEFFGEETEAERPLSDHRQPNCVGVVGSPADSHFSDDDDDDDDGLVLSDGSSSEEEDAVEEHLRLRLQSLQPSPMDGDMGTSHGSRVGSLKAFSGMSPLRRMYGSEGELAASMPIAAGGMATSSPFRIQARGVARRSDPNCKLGTSMPIGIPLMARRMLGVGEDGEEGQDEAFVPPHLLEQQQQAAANTQDLFRSLSGISPKAALKRERLAQRNYIMRATGFLETAPLAAPIGEVTDTLRESLMEGSVGIAVPPRPPKRVQTKTSSLSAALGLGSTPQ